MSNEMTVISINGTDFTLNEDQSRALDLVKQGKNVFITGSGGVGKSVLIHAIEETMPDTILCAPTGVAALNIGGATLHRIFTLPFHIATLQDAFNVSTYTVSLFKTVKTLIIDEVSMVRSDIFTLVDRKLRRIKDNDLPFGGLQVVVVGDFYQLSPVLIGKDKEAFHTLHESEFCFTTKSWEESNFEVARLDQVMRQSDEDTIELLNNVRQGRFLNTSLSILNENRGSQDDGEPIILCTTNNTVDGINEYQYSLVEGEEQKFGSKTTGTFKDFPVAETIRLKVGTKVVICANNAEEGYYNGDTGIYDGQVEGLNGILVTLNRDGRQVVVTSNTWENISYNVVNGTLYKEIVGTFTQLPIKLGYAITIHKSQGMSFDRAHINLGRGAFAHGQTYVALSRIRSLEGLTIEDDIKKRDIIIHPIVSDFYEALEVRT